MKTKRRKPGTGRGRIHHLYFATPPWRALFLRRVRYGTRVRIDFRSTVKVAVAA